VDFQDFLGYYDVLSSTIDSDAFFDLLVHRLWGIPSDDVDDKKSWAAPVYDPTSNPTARDKPPAFSGPTAYDNRNGDGGNRNGDQSHRRFSRTAPPNEMALGGGPPQEQRASGYSSITKSSIVFNEKETGEISQVLCRMRDGVARRGIKGWAVLADRFAQADTRRHNGITKGDWQRLTKIMGLGLSLEEQEVIYKTFVNGRRDGAMDYQVLMDQLVAGLSARRQALVNRLFQEFTGVDGKVATADLKGAYLPKNVPACMIGRKDPGTEARDFYDAVDCFSVGHAFDDAAFNRFFSMISSCYKEEDEFRLMTTLAFGLQGSS